MANMTKKLRQWRDESLLTPAQYQAIIDYEAQQSNNSSWGTSLMILGATIIGLGIISMIAANWIDIGDIIKLLTVFGLLIGLAIALFFSARNKQPILFETLLVSFIILCLATIGLTSQIYHQGGAWYHALLFWGLMTFPLILFSQRLVPHFIWSSLFLAGATISLQQFLLNDSRWQYLSMLPLLAMLLTTFLYQLSVYLPKQPALKMNLFFWLQISAIFSLASIDFLRSIGEFQDINIKLYYPIYGLACLVSIGILLSPQYKLLNRVLLLSIIALLIMYYSPHNFFYGTTQHYFYWSNNANDLAFWQADDIRAPALTIVILFLYATHVANMGYQHSFNLTTFLIGLRFLILYLQAFGGLVATGIGLMISGSIIIAVTWLWHKNRHVFQHWAKELSV